MPGTMNRPEMVGSEILTDKLLQFRKSLEEGTEQPVDALHVNSAILLSDLCHCLGLDELQHDQVLGERGVAYVTQVLGTRVSLHRTPLPEVPELVQAMAT